MRGTAIWVLRAVLILQGLWFLASHGWGLVHIAQRKCTPRFGNTEASVRAIPPAQAPGRFKFAVSGDPENGHRTFCHLMGAARERDNAFMIICGDMVSTAADYRYRYLINNLARSGFDRPVMGPPGNEDFRRLRDKSHGTLDRFREVWGPENFYFRHDNSLFVMLDNAIAPLCDEQIAWLESLLREHRLSVRHIFFFMHCPLYELKKGCPDLPPPPLAEIPLYPLMEKYSVDAVFTAHLHSYRSYTLGRTRMYVTGGIGGFLQEPQGFHHFIEVDVDGDEVRYTVVSPPETPLRAEDWETFERALVADSFFRMVENPWLYLPLVGLAAVLFALECRLRHRSAPVTAPDTPGSAS